jgi:L-lactate dehydrogenase complex protein LldE
MNVQLFIPCFVDQLFPGTAFNMVKILERLGCRIKYNPNQTCCGQPAFNAGYWKESKSVAKKFIDDFNADDIIVSPSGSCTGFVRNYYDKVMAYGADCGEYHEKLPIQKKVFEFTEFIVEVLKINDIGATMQGIATYHDACGALRECNIRNSPRELLSRVKGLEIRETDDCEICCGFGGTFAVKYEPISVGMVEQKVLNALKTGAEFMISTDLSCLMHLDGYIRKHRYAIKTMHIADVLACGW